MRIVYVGMLYCGFRTGVNHVIIAQVTDLNPYEDGSICADPGSVSSTLMTIFRMQYYSV